MFEPKDLIPFVTYAFLTNLKFTTEKKKKKIVLRQGDQTLLSHIKNNKNIKS